MNRRRRARLECLEPRRLLHGDVLDFGAFRSAELDGGLLYVQIHGADAHIQGGQLYDAALRDLAEIDQRGSGPSTLELIAGHVARLTSEPRIMIRQDAEDTLQLVGEWSLEPGEWQTGEYLHKVSDGQRELLLENGLPFQNPIHALDVNTDGYISSADMLLIVNDLNELDNNHLTLVDPEAVRHYVDTSGDGWLSSPDALLIANHINAQGAGRIARSSQHHKPVFEIPPDQVAPQISLAVTADPLAGWNLRVHLEHFTLNPGHASQEARFGEGHLHLFVDGVRTARLYEPDFYLGQLQEGDHEILVQVSGNDHALYARKGQPIQATARLTVPPGEPGHHHPQPIEVNTQGPVPTVSLQVDADAFAGWNLKATVDNFRLSSDRVSTEHVAGEGHLHLYLNGVRVTRLYGEWFHLASLPPGRHELRVELSANNHAPLHHRGAVIGDAVELVVPSA